MMNVLEDKFDFNGLTVNAGLKGQYIESIKRVGRIKKPMDAPTSWIQFNDIIFDVSAPA